VLNSETPTLSPQTVHWSFRRQNAFLPIVRAAQVCPGVAALNSQPPLPFSRSSGRSAAAFIVPTALSAIRVLVDLHSQFSVVSWTARKDGLKGPVLDFLGEPWLARLSVTGAKIWRGPPWAISLLAGCNHPAALYEASSIDGRNALQHSGSHAALCHADHRRGDDFSMHVYVTDFQLITCSTRAGRSTPRTEGRSRFRAASGRRASASARSRC